VRAAAKHYGIPERTGLIYPQASIQTAGLCLQSPARYGRELPQDDDGLVDAACSFYSTTQLLAVAGSQAAIQALPGLREPGTVALAAPGYAEHEHAWRQHGHQIIRIDDAEILRSQADVVS